jgi:hypothetical protein
MRIPAITLDSKYDYFAKKEALFQTEISAPVRIQIKGKAFFS